MKTESDTFLKKHFEDLDSRAYERDYPVYTDFLDINELGVLHRADSGFRCCVRCFGGFGQSERQMAAFLPSDAFLETPFPITALKIEPVTMKFAENLTHRDYLGALMNLMIKRELMGDLIVRKDENCCILFCVDRIAGFITDSLTQVKHTEVKVSRIEAVPTDFSPDFREEDIIITSDRLDSFVAACAHFSRSAASELIDSEKVLLNGKTQISHKAPVQENDILTVRGKGKLKVLSFNGRTQKDRLKVRIGWYD